MILKIRAVLFFTFLFIAAKTSFSQDIKTYRFNELEPILHHQNDTTYVINFWAMWCKPCVEELPEFEDIHNDFSSKKVKVILVSLDFGNKIKERLEKFLERKGIHATTVLLDDPDANSWINKVDEKWDGALPFTIIYKKEERKVFARQVSYKELEKSINKIASGHTK